MHFVRCSSEAEGLAENARVESNEIVLDSSVPQGDTWSFMVQLKVSELDLGHPSFAVDLFEGQNSNPSDTAYFDG